MPHILIFFPKKGVDYYQKDRVIYLYYDFLHTNIILNIDSKDKLKWKRLFPELLAEDTDFNYLEFGLGDRETYLTTKDWADLKFITAIKALFINTDSVIHISYYYDINLSILKPIRLNDTQYSLIIDSILKSFGDRPNFISKGYYANDAFYSAIYSYNLLFTCNSWVVDILKGANITVVYWSPFSYPLIKSLE